MEIEKDEDETWTKQVMRERTKQVAKRGDISKEKNQEISCGYRG